MMSKYGTHMHIYIYIYIYIYIVYNTGFSLIVIIYICYKRRELSFTKRSSLCVIFHGKRCKPVGISCISCLSCYLEQPCRIHYLNNSVCSIYNICFIKVKISYVTGSEGLPNIDGCPLN